MRSQVSLFLRLLSVVDTVIIAATLALVWTPLPTPTFPGLFALIIAVPLVQLLFQFYNVYDSHRLDGVPSILRNILSAQLTGLVLLISAFVICGQPWRIRQLALFSAVSTIVLLVERSAIYGFLRHVRRHGGDQRSVCVIGSWEKARHVASMFERNAVWSMRVTLVGIDEEPGRRFYTYRDGQLAGESLEQAVQQNVVDEILIAVPSAKLPQERATISLCEQYGILGRVLLQPFDEARTEATPADIAIAVEGIRRSEHQMLAKRIVDVLGVVAMLIVLAPVLLVVALLVKLSSPGPVIFRQRRVGLNGRQFTIYKFRTMVDGAEAMLRPANRSITQGPIFKDPQDYRVTPIGFILRRYSIDELPQLFNVFTGDMSLVGPRPLPVYEALSIKGHHRRRFSVLPGLTGMWQVSGRSDMNFEEWMKCDLDYVDGWSFVLDAKLLLKTIPIVFSGRGAY